MNKKTKKTNQNQEKEPSDKQLKDLYKYVLTCVCGTIYGSDSPSDNGICPKCSNKLYSKRLKYGMQ